MDDTRSIVQQIEAAGTEGAQVCPQGGGSKAFLRSSEDARIVSTSAHTGTLHYYPDELVIRVRAGTRLTDLQEEVAHQGQFLPFDPPHLGVESTVGGVVAAGLGGSARPFWGGIRDYVLGVKVVLPTGQVAVFGGDVMKNVAGYDVSRLMVGSMGSLGLILELALKVLPEPEATRVFTLPMSPADAIRTIQLHRGRPGLSAAVFFKNVLYLRFSGTDQQLAQAENRLAGAINTDSDEVIRKIQNLDFPVQHHLWRWDASQAEPIECSELIAFDWGGRLRWLDSHLAPSIATSSGVLTCFKPGQGELPARSMRTDTVGWIQERLKFALDPQSRFISYPSFRVST
ncbi:MAG: glycolate oxidase subunit GlcE [Pseudomonadales bacterium]